MQFFSYELKSLTFNLLKNMFSYAKALADGRKIGYLKYFSMSMGLGANYIIMFLSYAVAFWCF